MSAPQTNVEKQKRRHWPALVGIALALGVAFAALAVLGVWDVAPEDDQAAPAAEEQN